MGATAGKGGGTAPSRNAGEVGVSGECWGFTGNASCGSDVSSVVEMIENS